ncbi:MAG: hypothetical protein D3918_12475 [Candidatus Electrothrix sp. AX2]|nr:hypothetical protein [Candidatus Electrothrix gigas]
MSNVKKYSVSYVKDATIIQGEGNKIISSFNDTRLNANEELKQALASFRKAIESDPSLSSAQRRAATSDLDSFSEEVGKPSGEQDTEAKSLFWGRLTEIVKLSKELASFSATVAKFTGFA